MVFQLTLQVLWIYNGLQIYNGSTVDPCSSSCLQNALNWWKLLAVLPKMRCRPVWCLPQPSQPMYFALCIVYIASIIQNIHPDLLKPLGMQPLLLSEHPGCSLDHTFSVCVYVLSTYLNGTMETIISMWNVFRLWNCIW